LEHDLFGKPVSTFPDHALAETPQQSAYDARRGGYRQNGFADKTLPTGWLGGGFGETYCDGCVAFCAGAFEDDDGQSCCTRWAGVVVGGAAGQLVCADVA
jgi:hypothetical protein